MRAHPQGMGVHDSAVLALLAQVVVGALCAAVAPAGLNLPVALVAGAGKGGCLRVVQVVQHHHAAVLGPAQGVKLVVVPLAEREELLQAIREHSVWDHTLAASL